MLNDLKRVQKVQQCFYQIYTSKWIIVPGFYMIVIQIPNY